jgi:hypothetical protein
MDENTTVDPMNDDLIGSVPRTAAASSTRFEMTLPST